MAKSLGADCALKVDTKDPKEMAKKVEEALQEKPEVAIECSGAPPSVRTAIFVCIYFSLVLSSVSGMLLLKIVLYYLSCFRRKP